MSSNCDNCGKELFGRSDRKFCSDSCRNIIRKRRGIIIISEEKKFKQTSIRIQQNYFILYEFLKGIEPGIWIRIPVEKLLQLGYHINYCTRAEIDTKGRLIIHIYNFKVRYNDSLVEIRL